MKFVFAAIAIMTGTVLMSLKKEEKVLPVNEYTAPFGKIAGFFTDESSFSVSKAINSRTAMKGTAGSS